MSYTMSSNPCSTENCDKCRGWFFYWFLKRKCRCLCHYKIRTDKDNKALSQLGRRLGIVHYIISTRASEQSDLYIAEKIVKAMDGPLRETAQKWRSLADLYEDMINNRHLGTGDKFPGHSPEMDMRIETLRDCADDLGNELGASFYDTREPA